MVGEEGDIIRNIVAIVVVVEEAEATAGQDNLQVRREEGDTRW